MRINRQEALILLLLAGFAMSMALFVLDSKAEYSQVECKKAIDYLVLKGTRYDR